MSICGKCGKKNVKAAVFCADCGNKLEEKPAAAAVPTAAKESPKPKPPPSPSPTGAKKSRFVVTPILLVAAFVLLACCATTGTGAWRYKAQADDKKAAADIAISQAKNTLSVAELASEPGTKEESEYEEAKAAYDKAVALRSEASIFKTSRYDQAAAAANKSYDASLVINKRVEDAFNSASQLTNDAPDKLFDALFDVYITYPRTSWGNLALNNAESRLNQIIENQTPIDVLKTIAMFISIYPEEKVPESVIVKARDTIIDLAGNNIPTLKSILSDNQAWAGEMNAGGATSSEVESNFVYQSSVSSNVSIYESALAAMPSLGQDPEIQRLTQVLCEACRCASQCEAVSNAPSSTEGNTNYYTPDQVGAVSAAATALAGYLGEAEALYNKWSAKT